MLDEALGLEPQQTSVNHGHDQQPSVGEPAETRRLILDRADRLRRPVQIDRQHAVVVLVGEPELPVAPTRTFGKH